MSISITKRDYFWSYAAYILKFGVNLLLFPLILNMLSSSEYGLWVTFSSIGTVINLFDFGFSSTVLRNLAYAWGGAKALQKEGYETINNIENRDNRLFTLAYLTCRKIYSTIAIAALGVSLTLGLAYIFYVVRDVVCVEYIVAWIIYGTNIGLNLYYAYCTVALRAIGAIEQAQKATVAGYLVQVLLSYMGILLGWGIISLSVAGCACGLVTRIVSKCYLKRYENVGSIIYTNRKLIEPRQIEETFKIFWHNAKKAGISSLATVAMAQSTTLLCSAFLGVSVTGEYGICYQILTTLTGVAQMQYQTITPKLIQERLLNDKKQQVTLFGSAIVFSWAVFIGGCLAAILLGDWILLLIGSQTTFNRALFILLAFIMLFDMNYSMHAHYISLGNELPFVRSVSITAVVYIACSIIGLKVYATIWTLLVLRIVIEGAYMFWKWPKVALGQLGVSTGTLLGNGIMCWISLLGKAIRKRQI